MHPKHQTANPSHSIKDLNFTDTLDLLTKSVSQSSFKLYIKLIDINHSLLAQNKFIEALKNKCLSEKNFQCLLLCEKLRPNSRLSNFVRYYQRLTDKICIKCYTPPQLEADRRQFVIIDSELVAWQTHPRFNDFRIIHEAYRVKNYREQFENLFAHAERVLAANKLYI